MTITAKVWSTATRKQCRAWLQAINAPLEFDTETWRNIPEEIRARLTTKESN